MPKFQNETQSFRHRGFQPSDASQPIVMIFGNDPAPVNPDGSAMIVLWDHDVTSVVTVKDHLITPIDAGTVADPTHI